MRALTIARREFGAFFKSPVAYVVLPVMVVVTGWLFFERFFAAKNATMDAFFGQMPFLLLFFAPAMAMRLLAEERGSGTIELLLTFPVRDWEVVLGKFLAGMGFLAVGVLLTLPFAITVSRLGPLDTGPVVGGYLGTLLLGGLYLALGLFASTMTKNQIVAFIVGFALCFGLFVLGAFVEPAPGWLAPVLEYASPQFHFEGIAHGVISLRDVVYYASGIALLLLASVQVLESRRWR